MKTLKYIGLFVLGACSGAGVAVLSVKKYYEQKYRKLSQDEINSVNESLKDLIKEANGDISTKLIDPNKSTQDETPAVPEEEKPEVGDIMAYAKTLKECQYYNYSNDNSNPPKVDEPVSDISIIPPEEFGEEEDYDKICCTYYLGGEGNFNGKYGAVCDENDAILDEFETVLGDIDGYLTNTNQSFDDIHAIYIRNNTLKAYIELELDSSDYSEVLTAFGYPNRDSKG